MFCKKCGAALPSKGFVCHSCGAMMDIEQIKRQKQIMKENEGIEINLISDKYSKDYINRDYKKVKENKYLGALFIILIVIILIIIAILKVM